MSKSYFIDTIEFKNPFLNASGCWVKNKQQIARLYNSLLGGIVLKTCTLNKRDSNPMPNYYNDKQSNIRFNCMGLPNGGYEYYKNINNEHTNKPIILSVSVVNYDELKMILLDYDKTVNKKVLVEINMSCPNVEDRIPGYHCSDIQELIYFLRNIKTEKLVYGIKMPPLFEIEKIKKVADILNWSGDIIKFIVCCNSIPNGYISHNNEPILSKEYGGMSGKISKYIGLSNVRTFNNNLKNDIVIIGCGGISNNSDVTDYLNEGAKFVQLGSAFYDDYWNELDADFINSMIMMYELEARN